MRNVLCQHKLKWFILPVVSVALLLGGCPPVDGAEELGLAPKGSQLAIDSSLKTVIVVFNRDLKSAPGKGDITLLRGTTKTTVASAKMSKDMRAVLITVGDLKPSDKVTVSFKKGVVVAALGDEKNKAVLKTEVLAEDDSKVMPVLAEAPNLLIDSDDKKILYLVFKQPIELVSGSKAVVKKGDVKLAVSSNVVETADSRILVITLTKGLVKDDKVVVSMVKDQVLARSDATKKSAALEAKLTVK